MVKHMDYRAAAVRLAGCGLFTGMMATGYFYNVTFIQLGLTDLCRWTIGMSEQRTALSMALLALGSLVVAVAFGYWMMRTRRSERFLFKLRLTLAVVVGQTLLTFIAPWVTTEGAVLVWIGCASIALGVGMPVTFSLTVDLVPRRHRGLVAGLITAGAYFASNAFSSSSWQMAHFRLLNLTVMVPGVLGMAVLCLGRWPFLEILASQHTLPEFGVGRFVKNGQSASRARWIGLILVMFGVYFVDSLGFLRLLETPVYMTSAWQSPRLDVHLFIALTHVAAALIGGILYTYLSERHLFLWCFSTFALTHLAYLFQTHEGLTTAAPLMLPMLYAIAVSLYTVVNFAIWADFSTPQTISFNSALGVAFSGWSATFLSTALAMAWRAGQVPLEEHLRRVAALAMLGFLAVMVVGKGLRVVLKKGLAEADFDSNSDSDSDSGRGAAIPKSAETTP